MIEKARALPADVVQLDLEDSVPRSDEAKQLARRRMVEALNTGGFSARELNVRVNGVNTPWFEDDVGAAVAVGAHSVSLPSSHGIDDVMAAQDSLVAAAQGRRVELIVCVESPATLLDLEAIGRRARVVTGLQLGPADYSFETGSWAFVAGGLGDSEQLTWARMQMLAVAKANGWTVMDAIPPSDPRDLSAVQAAMRRSRNLGFDGCGVLFPSHLELANAAYGPDESEIEWARGVIERYEALEGRMAIGGEGALILPAHYEFAKRLLEFVERLSTER
jgi:citrate lyase subunit beta/citryl-CoA lyase